MPTLQVRTGSCPVLRLSRITRGVDKFKKVRGPVFPTGIYRRHRRSQPNLFQYRLYEDIALVVAHRVKPSRRTNMTQSSLCDRWGETRDGGKRGGKRGNAGQYTQIPIFKRVLTQKSPNLSTGAFLDLIGRRPTLPHTRACSTIGAEGLNFRVRDGNGWDPLAIITQNLFDFARTTEPLQTRPCAG